MELQVLKKLVFDTALELARRGPGWAQESVVLREVASRLGRGGEVDLPVQQAILHAWHDLFFERKLSWGYDLDNPNSPFYHVPAEVTGSQPVSATG